MSVKEEALSCCLGAPLQICSIKYHCHQSVPGIHVSAASCRFLHVQHSSRFLQAWLLSSNIRHVTASSSHSSSHATRAAQRVGTGTSSRRFCPFTAGCRLAEADIELGTGGRSEVSIDCYFVTVNPPRLRNGLSGDASHPGPDVPIAGGYPDNRYVRTWLATPQQMFRSSGNVSRSIPCDGAITHSRLRAILLFDTGAQLSGRRSSFRTPRISVS